jgi:hypothetical protein
MHRLSRSGAAYNTVRRMGEQYHRNTYCRDTEQAEQKGKVTPGREMPFSAAK